MGVISLGLGIIGVFVPGLPTTPFLLLTAVLFARGSHRMHNWLINHKILGKYITNYKTHGKTKKNIDLFSNPDEDDDIHIFDIFLEEVWL